MLVVFSASGEAMRSKKEMEVAVVVVNLTAGVLIAICRM